MSFGVDYAFSHPSITAMKAAGVKFVCRYISSYGPNDTNGKNLIPSEKDALRKAAFQIVVVSEDGATDMLGGHARGVERAQHANAVVKALGMPTCPVYFACDFDATPAQQAAINAFLDGAATVIDKGRVGIYGGYWPCVRAWKAGKVAYVWQAYAWSGSNVPGNKADLGGLTRHIFQYRNGVGLGGGSVDFDSSLQADFGQWPRPKVSAPAPAPAPKPSGPVRHVLPKDNTWSVVDLANSRKMTENGWLDLQAQYNKDGHLSDDHLEYLQDMKKAGDIAAKCGLARPVLAPGTVWYSG